MASYEATVPSAWSREETFDYLADFRNVAEWDPSMERAELLAGEPGAVGSRYRLVMSVLGTSTELEYETVAAQRPDRVTLRCENDNLLSEDTVTVAPDAAVTYHAELELKGLRKLIEPAAQLALTRASNRARDSLADKLRAH